jgi:2-polyprenyl-3-methyl-5-hydroxy-6-metoxy-1,4-benzoquinol methylase
MAPVSINEALRETSIRELRLNNFKVVVDILSRLAPTGSSLLEVGTAHGWFLEAAQAFFSVEGLEPDERIFERTLARGLPIRAGYFPDALKADEVFDVIVFNDVIEHIPDIASTLKACYKHLVPGGVLFLNLPNSRGIFFRTAQFLCLLGFLKPFERMWQKGFPSPHLHYFNPDNLNQLLQNHSFTQTASGFLPSLKLSGLYKRLSFDKRMKLAERLIVFALLLLLMPFIRLLPADIMYGAFRRD